MALIGVFGPMVFEVSGHRVRTFSEYSEKSAGRWTEHEPINIAPISEFLGPGLDELSLKITFTRLLGGEDPSAMYELLRWIARTGQHYPFITGNVPLSMNDWRIDSIDGNSTVFHPKAGLVLSMECTASFKEYN